MPASSITVTQKIVACVVVYCALSSAVTAATEPTIQAPAIESCPLAFGDGSQTTGHIDMLRREIARLANFAEVCDTRADFHAYRGTLLLSAGLAQDAAITLEKALLLDPNLAGAQIDYAQALSRIGQRQTAQDLINQVTQRPDITPQLKQWLQDGIRSTRVDAYTINPKKAPLTPEPSESVLADQWLWAGRIQATIGREANLNGVSHTTVLPLYLDSGIVEVALVDSERPRPGQALKILALVNGGGAVGAGRVRWTSAIQAKHTPNYADLRGQSIESRITYGQDTLLGVLSGSLGWSSAQPATAQQYKNYSYRLEYQPKLRVFNCNGAAHLGRAFQRHTVDQLNNGTDDHFGVELGCGSRSHDLAMTVGETAIGLSAGRYTPQNSERPGGNKNRVQLQIQHHIPLNWSGRDAPATLAFFGRWSHVRDQKLISVLFGPEPTQIQRTELGISYWHPLGNAWSVGVELDYSSQRSNNKLLEVRNRSVFSGVRFTFG